MIIDILHDRSYEKDFSHLLGAYFQEIGEALNSAELEEVMAHLKHEAESGRSFLGLLVHEGDLLGFICYQLMTPRSHFCEEVGFGSIQDLYVSPGARKTGQGRTLVKQAENHLKNLSVPGIYLSASTEAGRAFWQRMGYSNTGRTWFGNNGQVFKQGFENLAPIYA